MKSYFWGMKNRGIQPVLISVIVSAVAIITLGGVLNAGIDGLLQLGANPAKAAVEHGFHQNNHTFLSEAAWLPGWNNRVELIIDHSKIETGLINFPVLIHLGTTSGIGSSDASFIFNELYDDSYRHKIATTTSNGTTECYVEIEEWNGAGREAWLWVNVPYIASDVDTSLYLYYDRNHTDNTLMVGESGSSPAANVWGNNYRMVQHLNEIGSGAVNEFRDSTNNLHHGIGGNSGGIPARVNAKVGNGQYFDGDNDYIEINDSDDLSLTTTDQLMVSVWISPSVINFRNNTGDYVNYLGKGESGEHEWTLRIYNADSSSPYRLNGYVFNLDGGYGVGGNFEEAWTANEWLQIVCVVDSQYISIYKNGILKDKKDYTIVHNYPPTPPIGPIYPENGTAPLRIGVRNLAGTQGWFEGRMDELRISGIAHSDAWIKASYESEIDNLILFMEASSVENTPQYPDNPSPNSAPAPNYGAPITDPITPEEPEAPAVFTASNLTVTPDIVEIGEDVTIEILISNVGDLRGSNEVDLEIDDILYASEKVALDGEESVTITFSVSAESIGSHKVGIGQSEDLFTVIDKKTPANFTINEISAKRSEISLGESLEISALVNNPGNLSGDYEVILMIDNEYVDSKNITVAGGESNFIHFTTIPDTIGEHAINIGDKIVHFTVKEAITDSIEESTGLIPEISHLAITPLYDKETGDLLTTKIDYDIDNIEGLGSGSSLILKLFFEGVFWDEIEILALDELVSEVNTGTIRYTPPQGWADGTYVFQVELRESDGSVKSTELEIFNAIAEYSGPVISWQFLGLIIGIALLVMISLLVIIIYRKSDLFEGYIE